MFLTRWLTPRPRDARRRTFRPGLEALDARDLPSTLTVLNTNDSGPGSLRAAVAAAHSGDTITFDKSLSAQGINLTGGQIVLDKSLDIEGPAVSYPGGGVSGGPTGVSGYSNGTRAFDVKPGVSIVLAHLNIQGSTDHGGAILNEGGQITLSQCILGGTAYGLPGGDAGGGAVDNVAGSLSLTGCWINGLARGGDTPTIGAAGSGRGGAIYNGAGATLTVTNSRFAYSSAIGGFVNVGPNSTAQGTGGEGAGGAIYSAGGSVTISNTVFDSNYVLAGSNLNDQSDFASAGRAVGGAIYAAGGTLGLTGCTFTSNSSGDTGWGYPAQLSAGGAIYLTGCAATVANCEFLFNGAEWGLMAAGGAIAQAGGTLAIKNTDFTGNGVLSAAGNASLPPVGAYGGAVYVGSGTTTVQNDSFNGNAALGYSGTGLPALGGAIFNAGGDLTVSKNTTFANDFASTADPDISGPYVLK